MSFVHRAVPGILITILAVTGACSSDDDTTESASSSGSTGSQGNQQGSECTSQSQCQKLTCTCRGFSGTEVQKCSNGVCATSCSEAGCEQGSSSGSSGTSSGGQQGSECTSQSQCPKITCACGPLLADVQRCDNGVCAKSCEEAGCN